MIRLIFLDGNEEIYMSSSGLIKSQDMKEKACDI
jgi:hypothetical protein